MMGWLKSAGALAALCISLVVAAAHVQAQAFAQETPLRDDRGQVVATAQAPQRIVSLLPSLTETACALGACERLVGIDRYSNWPPEQLKNVPVLGGGLDPNIEAIVALRPDVVLTSNTARVVDRLQALGLRVVALEPHTQADVRRVLQTLGQMLHIPAPQGADRVWARIEQGMAQAAQSLPPHVAGHSVYFEVSPGPFAAGASSFLGEMLSSMGMRNVVTADMGPFPRLNPEFIVRAQPDVILLGSHSQKTASSNTGWQSLQAVRAQRVCGFDEQQSHILIRPGPRLDESARIIAQCLARTLPKEGGRD